MLQQTRVEAVKPYFARFMEALPDVEALAACPEDRYLKLWEGLGYYNRVRNLHAAAEQIMEQYGGTIPDTVEELLRLKGIGSYTAGAIASIAYNRPVPAVDGNVLRVVSRLRNDPSPIDLPQTRQDVTAQLAAIYPQDAGDFTQALMELGATLCGPNRKPDCESCPCKGFCLAFLEGNPQTLPVKSPKKGRRQEDLTVFILSCDGRFALEKRPEKGLLAGLWQFPNLPGDLDTEQALNALRVWGLHPRELFRESRKTHIFTHIQWNMKGIYLEVEAPSGGFQWMTSEEINTQAALPTAFRQFWER